MDKYIYITIFLLQHQLDKQFLFNVLFVYKCAFVLSLFGSPEDLKCVNGQEMAFPVSMKNVKHLASTSDL